MIRKPKKDELVPYQETTQELARTVRRELIKSRDQIEYVAEVTQEVQRSIAKIHSEGTCIAVQTLAGTSVLIKAAELQCLDQEIIEGLRTDQKVYLELVGRVEAGGSLKAAQVIQQLQQLPDPSALDRLEAWLKDYQ